MRSESWEVEQRRDAVIRDVRHRAEQFVQLYQWDAGKGEEEQRKLKRLGREARQAIREALALMGPVGEVQEEEEGAG